MKCSGAAACIGSDHIGAPVSTAPFTAAAAAAAYVFSSVTLVLITDKKQHKH
jgi:hypothetical protein